MNTDDIRRAMVESGEPQADLAANTGQTWTTDEMRAEFEVTGFMAPYVVVIRRSDGAKGTLEFTGGFGSSGERVYFGWSPHEA